MKFKLKPVKSKKDVSNRKNKIDSYGQGYEKIEEGQIVSTRAHSSIKEELDKTVECATGSEKNHQLQQLYDRLWTAADELRANSKLRPPQYSTPVLGILFLRYADYKFKEASKKLKEKYKGRDRPLRKIDYQAEGVVFLPEQAQYGYLLNLPEGEDIGGSIDSAMRIIESENEELRDVLPKVFGNMENRVLVNLLKLFHKIPTELDRDIFGGIYEYFLGKFAMQEGQGAGEFYTPTSIVRLIVEVLEPYNGMILDPACGSGGMFVQSAEFIKKHLKDPFKEISIYGQERASDTVRLCKMNLAIHGLTGDIQQGNTYYEDVFNKRGEYDFVMANPPFNVNNVDKKAIKDDPRYPFGIPSPDNANYLWIQVFYSMLKKNEGRAGFVMANSASDARHSELEIRKKLIENEAIDVIISVASNFFYTVTLPVTLWFLDKGKKIENTDKVLFIDARKIFNQIDRAHREFSDQQIEFVSNIVRIYRGQKPEIMMCSSESMREHFPDMKYQDVKGLCKIASFKEIEEQGWSLNPGRYVGVKDNIVDTQDFITRINELRSHLEDLNDKSRELEHEIRNNLSNILDDIQ